MFDVATIEGIKFYVYLLRDPRGSKKVFYIGKGSGNRIFHHLQCALSSTTGSEKYDQIRAIVDSGYTVEHFIVRHGLTEREAFEIESALIDFVGLRNISNEQGGRYSSEYGLKTPEEVMAIYTTSPLNTSENILLININQQFNIEMSSDDMYQAVRKSWILGRRRYKVKYVAATYRGLTREIYLVHDWFAVDDRWAFNGGIADDEIRDSLRYKSVVKFFKRGSANPVRYINC
jgi:uncharacterized protein